MKKFILTLLLLCKVSAPFCTFETTKEPFPQNTPLKTLQFSGNELEIPNPTILLPSGRFERYVEGMQDTLDPGRIYLVMGWDEIEKYEQQVTTWFCGLCTMVKNIPNPVYTPNNLHMILKTGSSINIIQSDLRYSHPTAVFIFHMVRAIQSKKIDTGCRLGRAFFDCKYFNDTIVPLVKLLVKDMGLELRIDEQCPRGVISFDFHPNQGSPDTLVISLNMNF